MHAIDHHDGGEQQEEGCDQTQDLDNEQPCKIEGFLYEKIREKMIEKKKMANWKDEVKIL